jgi:RNA polymerase sigma factor
MTETGTAHVTGELDQHILDAIGSDERINKLIEDNKPYIQSRVSRYAPYSDHDSIEDLFSIGLMAFYEAVKTYSPTKGHFYPFADIVIRRRVIDALRKGSKDDAELTILDDDEEEIGASKPVLAASMELFRRETEQNALIMEIEQFKSELEGMGITMDALAKHSPKHATLKASYKEIIKKIRNDADVRNAILEKKYFPVKRISEITNISPKKLERSRIYILAAMIIVYGEYSLLAEYLPVVKEI